MKRCIIEVTSFSKKVDDLITKNRLSRENFDDLKRILVQNPEDGDLIVGTGGIRKIRLKSSSKGKSGGFRVCYFDHKEREELFLILIYAKNNQENLTSEEKQMLKELTNEIKKR